MDQLTKLILTWELFESGVPKSHIANQLQLNRETVHIWINNISQVVLMQFLNNYIQAKKGQRTKRKVNVWLKHKIFQIREDNRKCCEQKISEYLQRDYGISLGIKAIYKILGEKYQLRSKWKHNQKRGSIPKANKPREVIKMDTVDFGQVFAFTGVDIFTKEISVKLYPSLAAKDR